MACTFSASSPVAVLGQSYYPSSASRASDIAETMANCLDYVLALIAGVGQAVAGAFRAQSKSVPEGARETVDRANTGRSMVGLVRTVMAVESLVTLKWFFRLEDAGIIASEGAAVDSAVSLTIRHPLAIAGSLSVIAARVLSFVQNFHALSIANLGRHAQRLGHAVTDRKSVV